MVIDGPVLDGSFNESAWKGLQKAGEEELAQVTYRETKGPSEYQSAFEAYAQQKASLVYGVGFRLEEATYQSACENPSILHVSIDGTQEYSKIPSNFFVASFGVEQASFLAGYLAAHMSQTGKIGFLGGIEGQIIDLFDYGYEAGARYAKPDITVVKHYAQSFTDVAKGRSIGELMLRQGVDIIFHAASACGNGMIEAVREYHLNHKENSYPVWAIGVDEDQYELAPEIMLTSVVKRVDRVVYALIKDLYEKNFPQEHHLNYGLKNNYVDLASSGDINIKYLDGVIEENGHLYVILNVDEIFLSHDKKVEQSYEEVCLESGSQVSALESVLNSAVSASGETPAIELEQVQVAALANWNKEEDKFFCVKEQKEASGTTTRMLDLVMSLDRSIGEQEKLVASQLEAEENFHLSPLNTNWFLKQKSLWQKEVPNSKVIIKNFYSPYSCFLWSDDYFRELVEVLKDYLSADLLKSVLVAGCGEGHEAYVIASAIRKAFGDIRYKVWALDNNLNHIMNTQSLAYQVKEVPGSYLEFMLNTSNGLQFDSQIKESVLFEFSDVTQMDSERTYGLIIACDLLSFLSSEEQVGVLKSFFSQLDDKGLLIVGYNEEVDRLLENWSELTNDKFKIYKKQSN
ncbi:UNVERIFIED_CONTAM: hypothetical protein PYX00_011916 [Menopon gallinae]|uniref:CheR-type methyltransferase domain-containing protein n=1 Tax=Menopon gallinae TaxID=328185 RepID=A0AAW2H8N9_9NEOP